MTCSRCGRRSQGRLCRDCERDELYGGFSADGGSIVDSATPLPDRVEAYVARNPDASVPQVLGKFVLDPEEYAAAVADRLGVDDPTAGESGQAAPGGVDA